MTGHCVGGAAGSRDHPPSSHAYARSAGLVLGVATALGHALSYAFSLVLSRALGPADFGALGALLGIAVLVSVPATALQTQVARLSAVAPNAATVRRGYRMSWGIGAALGFGLAAVALPLSALLRLDSAWSVLLLSVGLVPVSVIAARQGVLLGRGAFPALAATMVLVPALRLLGAAVAAETGMGLTGALGMQALGTWLGLAAVAAMVPRVWTDSRGEAALSPRLHVAGVVAAASSLLGLFVLANADVLLARVFLSDTESGVYAMGALGGKVVFWGTHFVALLVFPRVARGDGGRRMVLLAGATVAGAGSAAALASVPLAAPVLELLVGPAYADAAAVAPGFVVLGTSLALVQLTTYAAVAAGRHRFSLLLWGTVVAQSLVISLGAHDDVAQILTVCIVGTGSLALLSGLLVRGARP